MIIAHTFVFGERERFPPVECLVRESLTGGKKRENDFLWRSQEEDKRPGIDQQGRIAFSRSFPDFEKKIKRPKLISRGVGEGCIKYQDASYCSIDMNYMSVDYVIWSWCQSFGHQHLLLWTWDLDSLPFADDDVKSGGCQEWVILRSRRPLRPLPLPVPWPIRLQK